MIDPNILKKNSLGFWEVAKRPSEKELNEHYSGKYYQNPRGTYQKTYSKDDLAYFTNRSSVAHFIAKKFGVHGGSVIDLGCGEGFLSSHFQKQGYDVTCCDFSKFGVSQFNPDLLPSFREGDIFKIIDQEISDRNSFDLVFLENVLEHVLHPQDLLASLREIMTSNSIARITVPNDFSAFQSALVEAGLTKVTWVSEIEHLSYFNAQSLVSISEASGFEVLSLQADFPIEQFMSNPHANYWQDRSLGKGAHQARVFCTNYLIERDIGAFVQYAEAAARLEFGRAISIYLRRN
ncbi:MAG: class I SAM-dependent methyltransferase [Rhizobiaceae bacterium]